MSNFEHGSADLGRIHGADNHKKYFCHLTGFLEGIAASGYLERGEVEPLISECEEFVRRISDGDADDIVQDFSSELLDYETIFSCAASRAEQIDATCEKSSLNRFLGFCRGIACDGIIRIEEAQKIVEILKLYPSLLMTPGVHQIYVTCIDAIEDGIVSDNESADISRAISEIVGDSYADTGLASAFGVAAIYEVKLSSIEEDFIDRTLVLTGNFRTKPRSSIELKLAEMGATIAANVTSATHYLIVGGDASRDWIEMNRGTKIRKAQELRKKASTPEFVSEAQLIRLLSKISI